jgi:(2Fe-2S) ferredoxin
MAEDLSKARAKARKLRLASAERHVAICSDTRKADCAPAKQMKLSYKRLKRLLKDHDLEGRVIATRSRCLDVCKQGPICVVEPDGIWYGACDEVNLERIVREHLVGGRPVESLIIARRGEST